MSAVAAVVAMTVVFVRQTRTSPLSPTQGTAAWRDDRRQALQTLAELGSRHVDSSPVRLRASAADVEGRRSAAQEGATETTSAARQMVPSRLHCLSTATECELQSLDGDFVGETDLVTVGAFNDDMPSLGGEKSSIAGRARPSDRANDRERRQGAPILRTDGAVDLRR
jgi:hypothetical protein